MARVGITGCFTEPFLGTGASRLRHHRKKIRLCAVRVRDVLSWADARRDRASASLDALQLGEDRVRWCRHRERRPRTRGRWRREYFVGSRRRRGFRPRRSHGHGARRHGRDLHLLSSRSLALFLKTRARRFRALRFTGADRDYDVRRREARGVRVRERATKIIFFFRRGSVA